MMSIEMKHPPASFEDSERENALLQGSDLIKAMGFWRVVREDFAKVGGKIFLPGTQAVFVYRFGTWGDTLSFWPYAKAMKLLYRLAYIWVRNIYGIEFYKTIKAGRRLLIAHQSGIVIHDHATMGDDIIIRHNVTFGRISANDANKGPIIGSRVEFGPGSVLVGDVTIGDDVSIGPNCTVSTNVPSGRNLFVSPPRSFPKKADE